MKSALLKLLLVPLALPLMAVTAWKDSDGWVYVDGLPVNERVTVHFLNQEKSTVRAANACGWFQWTRSPGPISIDGLPVTVESTGDRCQNGVVVSANQRPIAVVRGFQRNARHVITSTGTVRTSVRTSGKCGLLRLNSANLTEFAVTSSTGSIQWAIASLPVLLPHQCKTYKDGVSLILIPEGQTHAPGVAGVAYVPPAAPGSGGGGSPPPSSPSPPPSSPSSPTEPQVPPGHAYCYVRGFPTAEIRSIYPTGDIYHMDDYFVGSLVDGKLTISVADQDDWNVYYFADYTNDPRGENYLIYKKPSGSSVTLTPDCN